MQDKMLNFCESEISPVTVCRHVPLIQFMMHGTLEITIVL